ncbi:MAG TPA: MFS transporter [Hyphomicrobiales bacterium]|nr:MFS transporter [Hyphomicrobiales bacterium]
MTDRSFALLAAVCLGSFVVLLDISVVNLALPALQADLHTGIAGLQWVLDAYVLCLSAFMLSAGALGDRYGRKRTWLAGIALFMVGSAVCALAPTLAVLIVGRVIQGLAGALVMPGALSIIAQGFHEPGRRARMIGLWAAFAPLALVVGPVLGGVLVDTAGWQSIFLINLPLGALTLVLGWRGIPESADPAHAAFDPAGQTLSVIWLGALTYGFIAAGDNGWTARGTIAAFAVAVLGLGAFVAAERRAARPMVPLALFRGPGFAAINLASFVLGFTAFSTVFLFSLLLQFIQGLPPIEAGLRMMPEFLAEAIVAAASGRLAARFGERPVMVAGYLVLAVSALATAFVPAGVAYPTLATLFVGFGVGMGLAIPATSAAAMGAVARERSGVASGLVNAARQVGTATGIALLGTILITRATTLLALRLDGFGVAHADAVAHAAITRDALPAALPAGLALRPLVAEALAGGFAWAMVAGGAAALVAVVAVATRRRAAASAEREAVRPAE